MVEKRRRPRRLVRPEAYVVCYAPEPDYIGQILDISLEGISFSFLETCEMPEDPIAVGIFMSGGGFFLNRLPFQMSYSNVMPGPLGSTLLLRRYGGSFLSITPYQHERLTGYISHYTEYPPQEEFTAAEKM